MLDKTRKIGGAAKAQSLANIFQRQVCGFDHVASGAEAAQGQQVGRSHAAAVFARPGQVSGRDPQHGRIVSHRLATAVVATDQSTEGRDKAMRGCGALVFGLIRRLKAKLTPKADRKQDGMGGDGMVPERAGRRDFPLERVQPPGDFSLRLNIANPEQNRILGQGKAMIQRDLNSKTKAGFAKIEGK